MSDSKKSTAKNSYEKDIQQLQGIVTKLEDDSIPLDEGLSLFEQGVSLTKKAQQQLSDAEQRVQTLTASGEKKSTSPASVDSPG